MKISPDFLKKIDAKHHLNHEALDIGLELTRLMIGNRPTEIMPGVTGIMIEWEKLEAEVLKRWPDLFTSEKDRSIFRTRIQRVMFESLVDHQGTITLCFVWELAHEMTHVYADIMGA